MERTIDTVRETPHWSYSAFNTYLTCPMRYYFRYIERAEIERLKADLDTADKTIRQMQDTSLKTHMMDVLCRMVTDGVECPDIGAAVVAYTDLLRVVKEVS